VPIVWSASVERTTSGVMCSRWEPTITSPQPKMKVSATSLSASVIVLVLTLADWARTNARTLDLIICTVNDPRLPLNDYLKLLRTKGTFIQVGAPEDKLPQLSAGALIGKAIKIGGSMIGSAMEIEEMLQLAVTKQVKAWVQTRPMKDANQAVVDMDAGKARFRYTLVNEHDSKL